MSDDPIWTGNCRLRWCTDAFGHRDLALFIGGLHIGSIMHNVSRDPRERRGPDMVWRAWIMTDEDGKSLGWHRSEQEAKAALVDAALRELAK